MSTTTLRRVIGTTDERLPLKEFHEASRKLANSMPLEITENGIRYEVFDVKFEIKRHMNTTIALYKPKEEV